MKSIAIGVPISVEGECVIIHETDVIGIYSIHRRTPGEKHDPRIGWAALLPIANDVQPLWSAHPVQEAMPTDPWHWPGGRFDDVQEAAAALVLGKVPAPSKREIAFQKRSAKCPKCGKDVSWLTDDNGKSGFFELLDSSVFLPHQCQK